MTTPWGDNGGGSAFHDHFDLQDSGAITPGQILMGKAAGLNGARHSGGTVSSEPISGPLDEDLEGAAESAIEDAKVKPNGLPTLGEDIENHSRDYLDSQGIKVQRGPYGTHTVSGYPGAANAPTQGVHTVNGQLYHTRDLGDGRASSVHLGPAGA